MTAGATASCASRPGFRLDLIDSSVQRPSNVAVSFTVDTTDGEPVPGLAADSFCTDPIEAATLSTEFDAENFGPNDDPRFDVRHPHTVTLP